jgi:glycosyltransferase involved in cell wall biosynthesis
MAVGESAVGRLFLAFRSERNDLGGGGRANFECAEVLKTEFSTVGEIDQADMQVCSFTWDAPVDPPRLFIDHGSFADASFWAYLAPRLRTSDTVLVSSQVCARVAERCFGPERPLLLNVPFCVDTELYRPESHRRTARRRVLEEHAIPEDGPLLLVVSGFVRRKNHHLAVLFLRALLDEVPTARMVIVGGTTDRPGSLAYRQAVLELGARLGVGSRLHLAEPLPQTRLSKLMAAADLLVHLTNCRLENFGLVVAEAMSAGLPVVGADWGGLRDLIRPGETGLLAPTFLSANGPRTDWLSLVRPAAALLLDGAAWRAMSDRSREHALRHLTREAYRKRLVQAVRAALARRGGANRPVALSAPATDLMFRTITLNAAHPEITGTGDEYRLLMRLDEGAHYRFLTGPAASLEYPPRVNEGDRLYPVVPWTAEDDVVRITDPAWPGSMRVSAIQRELLRRCDGSATLREVLDALGLSAGARQEARSEAQALVDRGVLCPLGMTSHDD